MLAVPVANALAELMRGVAWERVAMVEAIEHAAGERAAWMSRLVKSALRAFPEPPAEAVLAEWIVERKAFRAGLRSGFAVAKWMFPAPVMGERRWPVPALATVGELAAYLRADVEVLADRRGLSRASREERRRHYRYRWIAKRTIGHRLVEAPKPRLRAVQRAILDRIIDAIPPHDAAHGFRRGRSVATFAAPHVGREVVLRLDLQAFFSSVFAARVRAIFQAAGYPRPVARVLAELCTHRSPLDVLRAAPTRDATMLARLRTPHLPQGAPTSGALANLAAFGLDTRLTAYARSLGATYTRYADDLVLSGGPQLARAATTIVARISTIARDEGFVLNFRKTRVMLRSDRQRVAGVVVNDKLSVTRADVEELRAILHNCARTGPAAQNRDGHPDFRAYLLGRVAWVASLDPVRGSKLRAAFDRIRW
jgi:hypothetical protein